jgi:O-antigen ligase
VAASIDRTGRKGGVVERRLAQAVHHLLSFETLFVLFLYSNEIKVLLPPLPADETVLFCAASMAVGVWLIAREGIYMRGLVIAGLALLFVAFAILSFGWSPSKVLVKQRLAYLVVFNMWCVIGGAMIVARSRERTLRFLCLVLLLGLFVAARGLQIYLTYGSFRQLPIWGELGFTRTYLNWGYTVADGAGVALVITLFSRFASLKQLVAGGMLLLCAAFLLVGGARGPLLGLALASLVAIAVRPPRILPGRFEVSAGQLVGVALIIAAAAYVSWLLATGQSTTTLNRFTKLFDQMEGSTAVKGASRLIYWPAAFRLWTEAPWIGHGFASFSYLFHRGLEEPGAHPHNVVLQILAELGVVGLVLFGLFAWSGLRHARLRRLREDPLMVCVLIYFTTGLMNPLFARELTGGRKLFTIIGLLALQPVAQAVVARAGSSRRGRSGAPGPEGPA